MIKKRKLQLEIIDPTGNVAVTHHFYYEAGEDNRLRLTITDNVYHLDKDGDFLMLTEEEFNKESEHVKIGNIDYNDPKTKAWFAAMKDRFNKPQYFNPDTKKTQKLFDEKTTCG
jgi:hypothetical protein